jgi:carbon monoxide dehydrogenase subunit G
MELTGTQRIEAAPEVVYAALNDPEVLRQCIPGCEAIEKSSDTAMKAKVTLKIGPMKVTFNGNVTLSDLDPPNAYTITGEGSGGIAGFAKGSAAVRLEPDSEATLLHYSVKADVGGKIAQLGARLIDGTAKKLTGEFFQKLGTVIAPAAPIIEPVPQAEEPAQTEEAKKPGWFGKTFGTA